MMFPTCHNNRAFPPTTGELRLSNNPDSLQGVMPIAIAFHKNQKSTPVKEAFSGARHMSPKIGDNQKM